MANISRSAQLSIAQIMAGLEENPAPSAGPAPAPEAPQHDSAADDEDDAPQDTISALSGKLGMLPNVSTKTIYPPLPQ